MYQHRQEPFGRFVRHYFFDEAGQNQMAIAPGKCGCLLELMLNGVSVIDGYTDPDDLDRNSGAKCMPLFPFPNRLAGGQYNWYGHTYSLPQTDKAGPNAIHGFSRQVAMELNDMELGAEEVSVSLRYEYPGNRAGYPFPFRFDLHYRLRPSGNFETEMCFLNQGDHPLPAGFGWHPYFRVAPKADSASLKLPPSELVEVNDHKIPTGNRLPFDQFNKEAPLGAIQLDNCFAPKEPEDRLDIQLKGTLAQLNYWQECGPGKFNFFQLYIPAGRESVAIEPMTCNIDAFNNHQGLIYLEPGEKASAKFGVRCSASKT